jgi:hypothetical protein
VFLFQLLGLQAQQLLLEQRLQQLLLLGLLLQLQVLQLEQVLRLIFALLLRPIREPSQILVPTSHLTTEITTRRGLDLLQEL